ncbi:MAG: helix-turn-helix domain-containing protein [Devosia sp.]
MLDTSIIEIELPARLLLIEGRRELQRRLAPSLAEEFDVAPVVVDVTAGRPAVELMRGSAFDAVLADLDAIADLAVAADERISRLARVASGALIIVLSEDAGISVSLAAMRAGAHDCIGKAIEGHALTRLIGELARRHGKTRCLTRSCPQPEAIAAPESAPSIPNMRDLVMPMWRQEQRIIEDAIQQFAGNVALAAAALELSPSTIYRKRQAWADIDEKRTA